MEYDNYFAKTFVWCLVLLGKIMDQNPKLNTR